MSIDEEPSSTYNEPPQQQVVVLAAHRTILVWLVFGLNIALFGYSLLRGFSLMGSRLSDLITLINLGAKFSPLIDLDNQWWRLLTPIFLHGGLVHLGFNSYALYIMGPDVERLYGWLRFGIIYLVAGLAGSIGSYAFGSLGSPSIGASGAIFGLMGAMGAFAYSARETLGAAAHRNLRQISGLAALNLVIGFSLPGIDNYAHIGGLVAGILVGLLLAPRLQFIQNYGEVRLEAQPSAPLRWAGVVGMLVVLIGFTSVIHQQRLADPAALQELQAYRAGYLQELP